MHIAMPVPEKEMMYAKLNGVFQNPPSLDPSWQPHVWPLAPLLPVHQMPVMSQRIVGGRGLYKGRQSVYLSLAVQARDGGSCLAKENVVNIE